MRWYTSVTPTCGRLRQEDAEFMGSLGYIVRSHLKNKTQQIETTYPYTHLIRTDRLKIRM